MAAMSDKVAEISDTTHHSSLMNSLRSFIFTESFIDVQFICLGGRKVYAHKLMLISVSGLLKKIFLGNPDSYEMITIHLPDISSKILKIVVTFLYTGYMRLNSAEMDEFKMILSLLDIEVFQKPRDPENTEVGCSDPLSDNSNSSSVDNTATRRNRTENGFFDSNNVSEPVGRRICPTQGIVPAEYSPVTQSSTVAHVTSVPVDRGPQYITIRTDQLGIPNNCGEVLVSYSPVPVHHASSGTVVQHNVQCAPAGQAVLQDQTQCSTFTSNIVNNPVTATHVTNVSGVSSNVPPLLAQTGGQQILRLGPTHQAQQPIINSNSSFSSSLPEIKGSISSNHSNNKSVKRKSSSSCNRSSVQTTVISQEVIDLSDDDDDPEDSQKPVNVTTNRHKVKSRKSGHNSSNTGSASSSRKKQKKNSKDITEINLTSSQSSK